MTATIQGIGIIGCGLIGTKRARSLPSSCRLIAVHDTNRASAETLISEIGSGEVVDSIDEVIRDERIDVVIVATAHSSLASIALGAVENGKHVLIEKPGARNADELSAVKIAAEISGRRVRVGFNHRFHPAMLLAHKLINSGAYGDLLWIRGRYGHGGRIGYDREWRAIKDVSGGGELLDQGSHLIDLTRFFFGDVSMTYAHLTTAFWDMEVEDNAFLQLQPECGGTAWLHASWTEWKNTFSLEITLKTAKIDISGLGEAMAERVSRSTRCSRKWDPRPVRLGHGRKGTDPGIWRWKMS